MTSTEFLDWRSVETAENLVALFEERAEQHPDRLLIADASIRMTWGDMASALRGFSAKYADRIQDRDVAIFMRNSASCLAAYLGVLFSGGRAALFNAAMPKESGARLMADLKPALIIADHVLDFAPDAAVIDVGDVKAWMDAKATAQNQCGSGDGPSTYFFSGGTTGIPKRILYSHQQILAAGARMQCGWPLHEGEIFLPIAPFSHIYGYLAGVCLPLQCGGGSIVPDGFHPAAVLDQIEGEMVTVLGGGPPAIYQALMADPKLDQRDISSLRVCPGGGASFPLEVHRRWKELTGLTIYEGYGMTEMAPISVNTATSGNRPGTVGKPMPDTFVEIVDLEGGHRVLPTGEAGEIRIKGPHMMRGYCNNESETALVLRDGWVYTGDIGVLDEDGFLTITDRKKDMILHKGFNVFPREVEEAVFSHPAVTGVSVVGAPDERAGEVVVAYVTVADSNELTEDALRDACSQYLVGYRMPGRIEFLDKLPLTPAGKVDRMALRQRARESAA